MVSLLFEYYLKQIFETSPLVHHQTPSQLVGHCYLLSYILHTLCPWFPVRPGPPLVPGLPAAP